MPKQTPQFDRFAALNDSMKRVADEMTGLIAQAHREGIKDGVDLAAQYLDETASNARAALAQHPNELCAAFTDLTEQLRDGIRLLAHQIPDAEVTNG
ncbi:hypothetical protein H7I53_18085 [Mycolicibacterium pulveris]|uniref:Uncharacterized protein n=1 Tax=Mycolicibacterium pulveris TaxID=36813 RepID=A0A7I7UDD4_MYCPV|nr:hypothetical protein [Mycolicibacterium pulveris]MCV6982125.1 hypothetical protein [Mycolicibacterium pulveris]BBY78921.1 hypothetical protein MPUL_00790 [Mycolicibacterium pulveris]